MCRFYQNHDADTHRGYGPSIGNVFAGLRELDQVDELVEENWRSPAAKQYGGTGSHGNGGPMRVAPLALWRVGRADMEELAREQSLVTHAHPEACAASALQATAVRLALERDRAAGWDSKEFLQALCGAVARWEESESLLAKLHVAISMLQAEPEEAAKAIGNGVQAGEAVCAAVYLAARHMDRGFEDAMLDVISFGGDSDTIGCMAGAILGAYWGRSSIPERWLELCEGVDATTEAATALFELTQQ